MSDIRLKVITVEPQAAPLIVKQGNVNITDTTPSTSTPANFTVNAALLPDLIVAITPPTSTLTHGT